MLKLYEMNDELIAIERMLDEWAANHEGDITDFPLNDELDKLEGDRKGKLINIAVMVKSLKAEAKAYGEEKKRLGGKESALKNKAERLSGYISYNLGIGEKVEDVKATLSWRKSRKVVVEDVNKLPDDFIKTERTPILTDIKKAIEAGRDFDCAHIEESQNLQIK